MPGWWPARSTPASTPGPPRSWTGAHWLPRRLQYPYAAVRSLATYQPGRYRVSVDGAEEEYAAATVVVANSAYYGKGMKIAPAAAVDDGLLDVVVIEAASKVELMRSLPTVYDGAHVERPEVTVLSGKRVEVRGRARTPIPVGGDGEPLGYLPGLDRRARRGRDPARGPPDHRLNVQTSSSVGDAAVSESPARR